MDYKLEPEFLARMGHLDLMALRNSVNGNPAAQSAIAPYEHRAFSREYVAENPLSAPVMAVLPFGYALAKAVGAHSSRTKPSLEQIGQGVYGVGEGLSEALKRAFSSDKLPW
jgi:hypothetical protein